MFERNVFVKGLRKLEETIDTETNFLQASNEENMVDDNKAQEGATVTELSRKRNSWVIWTL